MVKRLQQSTAFCFKHFVIDSLPLMGRYFCKQISPFWPDRQSWCALCRERNEVRWRMMGQETSLTPPCSNLRSFGSKCTVLKKSAYDIVGTCWPLAVIPRPGIVPPFPPVMSLVLCNKNRKIFWEQTNFQVQTSWTRAIFENNKAWIVHRLPTKVTGGI